MYPQAQIDDFKNLQEKWGPLIDADSAHQIRDPWKRRAMALMFENSAVEMQREADAVRSSGFITETNPIAPNFMGTSSSTAGSGGIDIFDPVLISLIRRSMPNLMAYDVAAVQPMTGPTGLIFALRSRYSSQTGPETFYNEVNTAFSTVVSGNTSAFGQGQVGQLPGIANNVGAGLYNFGQEMGTAQLEALGTTANAAIPQMAFTVEKQTVTAGGRALGAGYTMELAQDLRAIHGLDAATELSNILTSEILAEINREFIRIINICAVPGSQVDVATPGQFDLDTDSNGRWSTEKWKGMRFQIEREMNKIARDTRRGKGNILITTSDTASALEAAGVLSYTPAMAGETNLQVDDTGNTFAGMIAGRIRVYIDPYASGGNYWTCGYKGTSPFDAGIFYCPYVPLQMVRAVDPNSYQPSMAFKTRYAITPHPFAQGLVKGGSTLSQDSNLYYRRTIVQHLM